MPGSDGARTVRAGLSGLAKDMAARLERHDSFLLAAGLTFYAAVAVVPLSLLALSLAGLLVGRSTVAALTERAANYFPDTLGIQEMVVASGNMGAMLGAMSFVAALIPATSYGEGLVRVFNRLAGAERPPRLVRGRLLVVVLLAALLVAALLGLAAVAVLPGIIGTGVGARVLGTYLTFLVGWVMSSIVLAVMYKLFSPRRLDAASTAWAAIAAGSFFTGMSLGWLLVLRFGVNVGLAYGGSAAIGTLVLIGVYLLLVQAVVIVGYAAALALADRGGRPLRWPRRCSDRRWRASQVHVCSTKEEQGMARRVRDIMTQELRTCSTTGSVASAATVMRDDDVGDVIVLRDDGTMCGIVTDRDVTVRAVAEGRDPSSTRLDDICSHDVETVSPDDDAQEAVRRMRDRGVRRMPVTENGQPVGMVSIGDLAIELDPDSALADISAQRGNL